VMSLDNVIGIAGAAKGHLALVVFGLVVSVPIIVWGSRFVLTLMDRFPVVILGGAALLGWIAGDMIAHDVVLAAHYAALAPGVFAWTAPVTGAVLVVAIGKLGGKRRPAAAKIKPVDLVRRDGNSEHQE